MARLTPPHQHLAGRRVTVIGAGIGGLSAGLAMASSGAQVRIFEQAPELTEVGAGIQISPNGMAGLRALGVEAQVIAASHPTSAVILHNDQGHQVTRMDLSGRAFRAIHRARLVEILAQAAVEAGARITFASRHDAQNAEADLIVGADGVRSALRLSLNPGAPAARFTGQTAWRALIRDAAGDTAETPTPADVFMGPGRHLVHYRLHGGLHNIVAVRERSAWTDESWSTVDDPQNMVNAFAAFGGPVPAWLKQVSDVRVWGLFRHPVAPVWQDGKRAILGDAAHPTLPFLAQGAMMAIEDAVSLAAHLRAQPDQRTALAAWSAHRRPRAQRLVKMANANARNYHLSGPIAKVAHFGLRTMSSIAPNAALSRFDWVYRYDPSKI